MGKEQPAQIPIADARVVGENRRGAIAVQVLGDVLDDLAHDVVRRRRAATCMLIWACVSRSFQQVTITRPAPPRQVGTVVLLDKRQREVQGAGDGGRHG